MADIIDDLIAMDDAALAKKLGFSDKIADFRKDLGKAAELDEKARPIAADKIRRMFEPSVYPGELTWMIKDAQREAHPKTNAACMCDNSPTSIMDD